jgi:tetraacyldisaccharide 4'-kinase
VVSVGNLTLGGTGKTPAVEMVARWLADEGRRVAIVSRGYGRRPAAPVELVSDGGTPRLSAERAGDEPLLLARRLPGVAVVVGADRLEAGRWTVSNLRPDVVLLDDGFQQRRLLKDVEIVCLDARAPWGPGGLFPRGTLREPPSALARAHLVIVTRADAGRNLAGLIEEIRQYAGHAQCLLADYAVEDLEDLASGTREPAAALRSRSVLAFAGIAAPERFGETLAACGAIVRDIVAFPDHHGYEAHDLDAVMLRARALGAGLVVTTEKDAVRLVGVVGATAAGGSGTASRDGEAPLPLWALRVRLEPVARSLGAAGRGALDQSRAIDLWRAELRTRVEAALRETRAETSR